MANPHETQIFEVQTSPWLGAADPNASETSGKHPCLRSVRSPHLGDVEA